MVSEPCGKVGDALSPTAEEGQQGWAKMRYYASVIFFI